MTHPVPRAMLAVALLLSASPALASGPVRPLHGDAVSFANEVLPLLTRLGCNAGACHGSPTGKNGFRLSLRGYDPALDTFTLTREAGGRRVNPIDPDASLILMKATARAPHEGGKRTDPAQVEYQLLRRWVAEGARTDTGSAPALAKLEVTPAGQTLPETESRLALRVLATFADGSRRDVTHLSRFAIDDESLAQVAPDGAVTKLRPGEVTVAAEYRNTMATARVLFLPPMPETTWETPPENNYIDRFVFAKLREVRVEPSPLCTDEEFVRRAFLDVTGTLPSPEEVRAFLADPSPGKRDRLIDELLRRDEFADFWALKWADLLGCNQRFVGKIGAVKYHAWIRQQIAANVPVDAFVRSVLTAAGGNYSNPPVGFFRRLRQPDDAAEEVAQLFLGVRMQCAKCHNHPGERWTQDDYRGLAAFFTGFSFRDGPFFEGIYNKEETLFLTRGQEPRRRRGRPEAGPSEVAPKFLGGQRADLPPGADRRGAFADWLTAPDNPFFARNIANRIWYHLLGRGIVEPVDDWRVTNPPSNPGLLDALAEDFVKHGFDRKHLIRTICRSRTYQLSSAPTATNAGDEKYFSHARLRLLGAEQLLDAIAAAAGVPEKFKGFPAGTTAVQLPDGEYAHPFLAAFGRPARALTCECERGTDTSLTQALHLVGGRAVQDKVGSDRGRVAKLVSSGKSAAEIVEELFLATLSRYPTKEETEVLLPRLSGGPAEMRRGAEDVLWALINHKEFLFRR